MAQEDTSCSQAEGSQGTQQAEEGTGTYNVLPSQTFCNLPLLASPPQHPLAQPSPFLDPETEEGRLLTHHDQEDIHFFKLL